MKKVSFYLISFSGGGAEREMIYIANQFAEKGYDVDLIVHRNAGPLRDIVSKNVTVIILDKNYLYDLYFLVKYIKRRHPKFILSTLHVPNWILATAKILAISNVKIFWRIVISVTNAKRDGVSTSSFVYKSMKFVYPILSCVVNKITCVSKGVEEDFVQNFLVNKKKVNVMYNPAYTSDIHELAEEKVEHPWFNSRFNTIVSLGRLSSQKDYETLIRSFKLVTQVDTNARLFILGEGKLRDALQNLIESLGLSEMVDLHGFELNPYKYLSKADVFVLSSIYEGFGNVIVEALALNVPVISTDCPSGPAEILNDGEWGRLVPVCDITALSRAILDTLEEGSKDKMDTLDRAKEFSVERVVEKYINLIDEN
ncbi:glycosyltransferase [Vibrio breoganii]|uniref:glycosyltransferase n=1 Tax=Vibrio breoganii TaxID=553239 RepID=UPI0018E49445|nr:glycosyltransferase [Vibrio breoganii]